eukprot:gnl/TRDRNA2_/TRDRNA2_164043_c0_seq1.p1 gnl/TRDRNA2_/TRDRNA2_164043_c0~~gnl/TRDRNA2_/TRDRNA2_164043_c0_seq1.p1  ORF type:complete len:112 (-),score=23.11 gnl/TRDRNA2_/TRDRNA2_164043_c0_seq1:10-303(-)
MSQDLRFDVEIPGSGFVFDAALPKQRVAFEIEDAHSLVIDLDSGDKRLNGVAQLRQHCAILAGWKPVFLSFEDFRPELKIEHRAAVIERCLAEAAGT